MIVATELDIPINETVGRTWNEAIVNMTSGIETDLDFYQALKQRLVEFGVPEGDMVLRTHKATWLTLARIFNSPKDFTTTAAAAT